MRFILFFTLFLSSFYAWSGAEHWRCKPTGSYDEYHKMVAELSDYLIVNGIHKETVQQMVELYGEKPHAGLLRNLRKKCPKGPIRKASTKPRVKKDPTLPPFPRSKYRTRDVGDVYNDKVLGYVEMSRQFYTQNHEELAPVAQQFGADLYVVSAILGIESHFCRFAMNYNALHVFLTGEYFYNRFHHQQTRLREEDDGVYNDVAQLFNALLFVDQGHVGSIEDLKSSYAGALGCLQFLPSSVHRHAQDADGDGRIELYDPNNLKDVVASVATYLKDYGWSQSKNWCEVVDIPRSSLRAIKDHPKFLFGYSRYMKVTAREWANQKWLKAKVPENLILPEPITAEEANAQQKYQFLLLREENKPLQACLVTENFRVIWYYNHGIYDYAYPVLKLADEIRAVEENLDKG